MKRFFGISLVLLTVVACHDEGPVTPGQPESVLAGGETTIFSTGPDAFTFPLANLDQVGIDKHFIADGIFGQQFVSAPADQFGGIGPLFNQNSCESCHVRNGRGIVPQYEGDPATGLLLRLSMPGAGEYGHIIPVPGFGGQLQNKAIFNVEAEGKMSNTEVSEMVHYLDGMTAQIVKPQYSILNPYTELPAGVLISPRLAPPVYGLGLLEAIPDNDILGLADEADIDGDGISGKPNMVWDILAQSIKIGRFGWKAEQPTAGQQAADAAHNDMGLTSFYFPTEHCEGQMNCEDGLQSGYDADDETTIMFAFYFQTLAVPAQRNYDDAKVIKGTQLFDDLKCGGCHTPKHITGAHEIASLSYQTIFPYTDMLLHDMGEGLADHRPTYQASGQEWRTAPLWGIGLTQVVNPKATFLHDGRARTLEEAILWHGGEAEASKTTFMALSQNEREAVIAFLESL
jgi:CxxC motif-containing protein (DUF1111 family)